MAKWLARLFFSSVRPLMDKASRGEALTPQDLAVARHWPEANAPLNEGHTWQFKTGFAFLRDLLGVFHRPIVFALVLNGLFVILEMAQPALIKALITEVQRGQAQDVGRSLGIALAMGALGIANMFALQHGFQAASALSVRLRAFLADGLARVALSDGRADRGKMLSHLSTDLDAMADLPLVLMDTLVFGSKIVIGTTLLAAFVGWSALTAVVLYLLASPILHKIVSRFRALRNELTASREERITLIRELLTGFRLLRVHGWAGRFAEHIDTARVREAGLRARTSGVEAWTAVIFTSISALIAIAVFTTHALRGGELNPALVAAVLSVVALLNEPFAEIAGVTERWSSMIVGAKRLGETLGSPQDVILCPGTPHTPKRSTVHAVDRLTVNAEDGRALLQDVSVTVKQGERVGVIGAIGSGKSILLRALAGELASSGEVIYAEGTQGPARVALVGDAPFLFDASIRDNLGASAACDDDACRAALRKVGFDTDLLELPEDIFYRVGAGGSRLSGGQRQRLALARALLAKPDVLLLDDPLSGLDSVLAHRVAQRIFRDHSAYPQTIIMATQRAELLPYFDRVLVLESGKLVEVLTGDAVKEVEVAVPFQNRRDSAASTLSGFEQAEEDRGNVHAVSSSVFFGYFGRFQFGWTTPRATWAILLALSLVAVVGPIVQTYWLGLIGEYWNAQTSADAGSIDFAASRPVLALGIAAALALLAIAIGALARIVWTRLGLAASSRLHAESVGALIASRPDTVDELGASHVLNRLLYDVSTADVELPRNTESAARHIAYLVIVLALFVTALPILALPMVGALILYWREQRLYRPAARSSKRLHADSRTPLLATFQELMAGGATIRSLKMEAFALRRFQQANRTSADASLIPLFVNRYFSVRVTTLGAFVSALVALSVASASGRGALSAPIAATVLTLSLTFWDFLNWTIRVVSELESRMTAAERLMALGALPAAGDSTNVIQHESPGALILEARDLVVAYPGQTRASLGPVSFSLTPGRIKALVGRSGSGKTTLLRALTGQVALTGGTARLAGGLRGGSGNSVAQIAWVPQEPWLFSGSLRNNLDPLGESADEKLNALLGEVGLDFDLDSVVDTDGMNFSLGARQLIGVVRGVACQPEILLLDEPTSGLNADIEERVMCLLERLAKTAIVVIVAHKPTTIARCDEKLSLRDGRLIVTHAHLFT